MHTEICECEGHHVPWEFRMDIKGIKMTFKVR